MERLFLGLIRRLKAVWFLAVGAFIGFVSQICREVMPASAFAGEFRTPGEGGFVVEGMGRVVLRSQH